VKGEICLVLRYVIKKVGLFHVHRARSIIRNLENKKLLTLLKSFTLTTTMITVGLNDQNFFHVFFAPYYRTGIRTSVTPRAITFIRYWAHATFSEGKRPVVSSE
jgi:hypothetical protein